jgi:hypothetical protein
MNTIHSQKKGGPFKYHHINIDAIRDQKKRTSLFSYNVIRDQLVDVCMLGSSHSRVVIIFLLGG